MRDMKRVLALGTLAVILGGVGGNAQAGETLIGKWHGTLQVTDQHGKGPAGSVLHAVDPQHKAALGGRQIGRRPARPLRGATDRARGVGWLDAFRRPQLQGSLYLYQRRPLPGADRERRSP